MLYIRDDFFEIQSLFVRWFVDFSLETPRNEEKILHSLAPCGLS
jgi:hypothetical protein